MCSKLRSHRLLVLSPNRSLNGRSTCNSVNPYQQVREILHLILRKTTATPVLHPRPSAYICHRVLPFPLSREIVFGNPGEFTGQLNFKNPEDAERLLAESIDADCSLWLRLRTYLTRYCEIRDDLQGICSCALLKNVRLPWYGAPLPCQKKSHWWSSLCSRGSLNAKRLRASNFKRYNSSAELSMTLNAGDSVASTMMGILPERNVRHRWSPWRFDLPFGFRFKYQSFFCSLVDVFLGVDSQ